MSSGTISAIECDFARTNARAARLGTYPNSTIERRTLSARSGSTDGELLTTRDTVARETPACAATISSVGVSAPLPTIRPFPRSTAVSALDGALHDARDQLLARHDEQQDQRDRRQQDARHHDGEVNEVVRRQHLQRNGECLVL